VTVRRGPAGDTWLSALVLWLATSALAASLLPAAPQPVPAGRLAFIGGDGNVYVTTSDLHTVLQLTRDATTSAEGEGLSYHRIAWSQGGSLAFAAVERTGASARGWLYTARSPGDTPHLVAHDPAHFYIYTYWSPTACPGAALSYDRTMGANTASVCRAELAYLIARDGGVGLHLVELGDDSLTDRLLATGRPFYLSWAPDGEKIAWHGGDQLAIEDRLGMHRQSIPSPSPAFGAPAWSPRGDSWLGVVRDAGADVLTAFSGRDVIPLLTLGGAEVAFSWSPDGSSIAYAVRERANDPFYSPVYLLDPETGESTRLTPAPFRCLAFFWSPDGRRIAYLSWLDLPGETWAQWRVIDVATGEDRGFAAFRPSPLMQFALHSFSQYAQSHRFWSPDGRYLVYASRDERGADRIWLVDTHAAPGIDPILVTDGPLAYWSFR